MRINGQGTFLCYKYAGMQMTSQGRGGRIIGASSVAGKKGALYLCLFNKDQPERDVFTQGYRV